MKLAWLLGFSTLRSLAAQVDPVEEGSGDADGIADKLQEVLNSVQDELKALIKFEFGITFYQGDVKDVEVEKREEEEQEESQSQEQQAKLKTNITVQITGLDSSRRGPEEPAGEGDAIVEVRKGSNVTLTTLKIQGSTDKADGTTISHNIGKKLVQAFEDPRVKAKVGKLNEAARDYGVHSGSSQFHSLVDKVENSLSAGGDENASQIASRLAEGLKKANANPENKVTELVEKDFGTETWAYKALERAIRDQLRGQLERLRESSQAHQVAGKIRDALQNKETEIEAMIQHDFGLSSKIFEVKKEQSNNKVTVEIGGTGGAQGTATVEVEGKSSTQFRDLVAALKTQVQTNLTGTLNSDSAIAGKLKDALDEKQVRKAIAGLTNYKVGANNIHVSKEMSKVTVTIIKPGASGEEKTATVQVTKKIEGGKEQKAIVEFKVQFDDTEVKNQQIADTIKSAFDMVYQSVKGEYQLTLVTGTGSVAIEVLGGRNSQHIANRLAKATKEAVSTLVESLKHKLGTVEVITEAKPITVSVEVYTQCSPNSVTVSILGLGGGQGAATLLVKGHNNNPHFLM